MSKKYWKGFRVDSIRLQSWDYGSDAAYFVTICTKDRQHFFGQITYSPESLAEMRLTPIGQLAQQYWQEIPQQFPFAQLKAFVIMPDHMHGIIIIEGASTDAINRVCTGAGGITGAKNPMLSQNLSRIIRWYKGRTTYESRKTNPNFTWQPRFYEHIIRDDRAFKNIANYIYNNPKKWAIDKGTST